MDYVKKYEQCQKYAPMIHQAGELLHSVTSPWPFIKWGMDIVGPLPAGRGAYTQIREKEAIAFIWKNIICRFGIPKKINCDNGPQFVGKKTTEFFEKWRIKRILSTPYHPAGNGQDESSNKKILNILKKKLEDANGLWPELLPEVGELNMRYSNESGPSNDESRLQDLDEVKERRDIAHIRMIAQKQEAKRYYNKKSKV
uniref:Endogenous retrovirus group K member 25 Pol protein-like n=1 Tax=Nicotiana tabacum TaxID=4097 RepID=A0A1S3ZFJ9_TOBAC|nr:PREDICTED: endogenous retrovirus group K member 25 Pol protein-like [Nicotiana tabacum]